MKKKFFEAVEAAEAGFKHSDVEGTRYRRKESPIQHAEIKNPLDFCSISDRSVPLGLALLPWVSIKAIASSGVKPTLRDTSPWDGKKSSGLFISHDGKRHYFLNRMEEWVDNFDAKIHKLTSGDNDLTLATQLEKAYQRAFDDGVGFSIEKPDGVEIAQDMSEKIEAIFEKNIEALQVYY